MTFKNLPKRILRRLGYSFTKIEKPIINQYDLDRLSDLANAKRELKLHFGCGARVLKDWINIDFRYVHYAEYLKYYTDTHYPESIRGDKKDLYIINILETGLPIPNESVDLIFHEDFFEHLTQKEQIIFLAETRRVLKKGAVHRINTPNLKASMRDNSTFEKGKDGVFTGEWEWWHHYSVITPAILEDMAKIVGYSEIKLNSRNNSIIANMLPLEYRPDEKDRPAADSNVFADLIK
jgi:hypothetical protein